MSATRQSTTPDATAAKSGTHKPLGCDSETSERIETVVGPVNVRIRRWPWDGGRWTRHEVLVETPQSRKDGTGYKSLGAVEDLTDKPVANVLAAHLVASRFVQDSAARSPRRRTHAPDRSASPPSSTPPGPGAGEAVTAGPKAPRPMPPVKQGWDALYALLHVRGKQHETHVGPKWDAERPRRIKALLGVAKSSRRLTADALSVLVDDLTADMEAAGVDVEKLDREYADRRAAASSAPAVRSTVPSARSRARA